MSKFPWFYLRDLKSKGKGEGILGLGILSLDPIRETVWCGAVVCNQGRFCPKGHLAMQKHFFLLFPTGRCYWQLVASGKGCC